MSAFQFLFSGFFLIIPLLIKSIAAARARGVRFGRPEKEIPADFGEIVAAWERKQLPISEVLTRCDMSEATFYRRLREYRLLRRDTED